jgi:hypothetical protein
MGVEDRLRRVEEYRDALRAYRAGEEGNWRSFLNEKMQAVRRDVLETGCLQTITISPPPAIGGMLIKNADPFGLLFNAPYGANVSSFIIDMLEQTIGVLKDPEYAKALEATESVDVVRNEIQKGYVFIAMPMAGDKPEYEDVHDTIKQVALDCGLHAERVDDVQSNERITDRLLESIRRAQYVVADLTDSKPNVFYEAGYAYGIGKIPVYIARQGTKLEFDLKDYPTIFFRNMRELRDGLSKRLNGIK